MPVASVKDDGQFGIQRGNVMTSRLDTASVLAIPCIHAGQPHGSSFAGEKSSSDPVAHDETGDLLPLPSRLNPFENSASFPVIKAGYGNQPITCGDLKIACKFATAFSNTFDAGRSSLRSF